MARFLPERRVYVKEDPPDTPNLEPVPGAEEAAPKARSDCLHFEGRDERVYTPSTIQLSSMLLDNHSE